MTSRCPICGTPTTTYPDGRRTCVHCEWEELKTPLKIKGELTEVAFLRDLADRLMRIPVVNNVDQFDAERLLDIAMKIERYYGDGKVKHP